MSIIQELFTKSIYELNFDDIQNFFLQSKQESEVIEYKSFTVKHQNNYNLKEKSILKTICAFLNSNGGLLIWGAPIENKDENGNTLFSGDLSPINRILHRDDFMSKIINSIIPIPIGIRMQIIETPSKDGCIAVFEIPESNYKPHRFDQRYWARFDGQTNVAPHHYVEALFKQIKYPNLEGFLVLRDISRDKQFTPPAADFNTSIKYTWLKIEIIIFNFSELINEEKLSFRVVANPGKFRNYKMPAYYNFYHMDGHEYRKTNVKDVLHYGEPLTEEQYIIIDPNELEDNNFRVELFLFFGGLKSPQKRSTYKLQFNNYDINDCNSVYEEINENLIAFEAFDKTGISKQEMLKMILGR